MQPVILMDTPNNEGRSKTKHFSKGGSTMMKSMGSFKGFVVVALVSVSVLMLAGCPDRHVAKMDDMSQGMVEQQGPDRDFKAGDLIVGWGDKRTPLKMNELIADLNKNGAPGGGNAGNIVKITFYRSDGTAFVAGTNGEEIKPCAEIVNGKLNIWKGEDGKPLCKNLTGVNISGIQKVTINTSHSPDCSVDFYCNYAVEGCR
jgi:hypothetical protein